MPTIYIEQEDLHIKVQTTEISATVVIIRCRIVLDYRGLEVVLQDQTIVYIVEGLYSLIGPEN